jgi:hypothetical protein
MKLYLNKKLVCEAKDNDIVKDALKTILIEYPDSTYETHGDSILVTIVLDKKNSMC